jgi:S-adenosylmethionine:tRNA ribosyltransferase-isomerase
MMVVHRKERRWENRTFSELPEILGPEHFLVLNSTRVFPARLRAHRPGRHEEIEVLLIQEKTDGVWNALIKPARKATPGIELQIRNLRATILGVKENGSRDLRFQSSDHLMASIEEYGEPPLPPYIRRSNKEHLNEDRVRYQTIYARETGSVAAPTAGLHFTSEVFHGLSARGVSKCEILLHVGYGTFQPVRCDRIEEHRMEPEYYEVTEAALASIREWKSQGCRLIAVGTTTARVLEHLAMKGALRHGSSGFSDLFIYPGFTFRLLDGLLTNFHLPRSTLLMLVCAFAGRDLVLECYREAVQEKYRFFSYGDCMLIL